MYEKIYNNRKKSQLCIYMNIEIVLTKIKKKIMKKKIPKIWKSSYFRPLGKKNFEQETRVFKTIYPQKFVLPQPPQLLQKFLKISL